MIRTAENYKEKWIILFKEVFFSLIGNYLRPSNNSIVDFLHKCCCFDSVIKIYENGEMFTWIWVFLE